MKKFILIAVAVLAAFSCNTKNNEGDLSLTRVLSAFAKDADFTDKLPAVSGFAKPALHLVRAGKGSFSKMGGRPSLPGDFKWPAFKGKPLSFLLQVKFSEINGGDRLGGFPSKGLLYVFYDQEQSTWGFDPKDRESWRLLYVENESIALKVRDFPSGLGANGRYNEKFLTAAPVKTYPSYEDDRIGRLKLTEGQLDEYINFINNVYGGKPRHIFGGYPSPQQGNDMDLESQLVSNGLYCGDGSGYDNPRARTLEPGRHDWMLLLQVDSDDETGMMWGDSGMLYFWIRKKDLERRDFKNVWMILQCG